MRGQAGQGICSWGGGSPLRMRSMHAPADRQERGRVSQSPTPRFASDAGTMREIGKRGQKKKPPTQGGFQGAAMPSSSKGLSEAYLDDLVVPAVCALERAQVVTRFVGWLSCAKPERQAADKPCDDTGTAFGT